MIFKIFLSTRSLSRLNLFVFHYSIYSKAEDALETTLVIVVGNYKQSGEDDPISSPEPETLFEGTKTSGKLKNEGKNY